MSDEIIITRSTAQNNKEVTSTFPTETIDLPSEGKFYASDNPLSSGEVEMKFMTAKEEDILTSPNLLRKGKAIDKLLESLIVNKNIDLNTLLLGDKTALLYAARRLGYGDAYGPMEIQCPKCSSKNTKTVDLSKIEYKKIDLDNIEPGQTEFSYSFPNKTTVTIRLLTSGDEKLLEKDSVAIAKIKKDSSSEITGKLKCAITSLNGDRDRSKINNFVDNMLSMDSVALRRYIKSITPDIDNTFNFECDSCSHEERVVVPITTQFLWPDITL